MRNQSVLLWLKWEHVFRAYRWKNNYIYTVYIYILDFIAAVAWRPTYTSSCRVQKNFLLKPCRMNFDPWAIVRECRAREASDVSTAAITPDVLVFLSRSSVWWLQNKFQTQLPQVFPHQSVAACLTHSKYLLCPWLDVHLLPTFSSFRLAASLSVAPLSRDK